jgi:hypothetical protein
VESPEGEAGKHERSEPVNPEATDTDHDAEDSGEAAPLVVGEPSGVDLDHPRSPEGLQVAVDQADADEPAQGAHERADEAVVGAEAEQEVHQGGAEPADGHGPFAADSVGEEAVPELPQGVGPVPGRVNGAELLVGEPEGIAEVLTGEGQVVAV